MWSQTARATTAMPQVSRSCPTQNRCTGRDAASRDGVASGFVAAPGSQCVTRGRTHADHADFDAGLPISETCIAVTSAAKPIGERPVWRDGVKMALASVSMTVGL